MRVRLLRASLHEPPHTILAGALLAVMVAGCGGGGSTADGDFKPVGSSSSSQTGPSSSAPAVPAASALPTGEVNETVLRRYLEYQKVYKRVYELNNPAELPTVAADPLLTYVTNDVEQTKAKGEIWRFTNIYRPKIYARAKDGATVYVIDCVRTMAGYRFSSKTGNRTAGGSGDAFLYRTAVRFTAGTWKVSDTARGKKC